MKHRFRFFAQQTKNESGYSWSITGEELRHLSILRLSPGDSIEVFDGKGSYSFGIIESLKPKKEALVQSKEIHFEEKPKKSLSLAIGALKPKTFEDLLPCLVELGLDSIHVFTQQHTEKFRLSEKNKER